MVLLNHDFDRHAQFPSLTRAALEFHRRFPGYAPTRLHVLQEMADTFGAERVFVKDESNRFGVPAFKILGASWATLRVLRERFPNLLEEKQDVEEVKSELRTVDAPALFAATDGNHGRAVAHVARLLDLKAHIYVPSGTACARVDALRSEGATVTIVNGTYDEAVASAAQDAMSRDGCLIQDNGWEGYEKIPHDVIEGYSTMFWEIDDQLAEMQQRQPTHVIVQLGNGTFGEAAVRHFRQKDPTIIIVGVEPESAACVLESLRAGKITKVPGPHTSIMAGMNCDSPSLVSFPVLQTGLRACVSISDDRAKEAMRLFARHGIVSGETGAAGLGAVLELYLPENDLVRDALHFNHLSKILIISTEGATDPESYDRIVGTHS